MVPAQLYPWIDSAEAMKWGRVSVNAKMVKRFFTILLIWLLRLFSPRQKGGMKGKESSTGRLSKAQTVAFISLVWFGSQCSDGAFQTFQSISWSWSFLQTWSQMVSEADLAAGRKISVPTSHDPSQTQCGMIFLGTSTCRRLSWWRRSASMSFLSPEPLEKAWDLERSSFFPPQVRICTKASTSWKYNEIIWDIHKQSWSQFPLQNQGVSPPKTHRFWGASLHPYFLQNQDLLVGKYGNNPFWACCRWVPDFVVGAPGYDKKYSKPYILPRGLIL